MAQRQRPQIKLVERKTIPRRWIQALRDTPMFMAPNQKKGWEGYEHFTDFTMMTFNKLIPPSQNCTMPSFDKIIPDKGKTLYGQPFTENSEMNGNKERFKNLGGIEMEIRNWSSTNNNLKDVIEAGYFNNRLVFSIVSGSFQLDELVIGGTSGATGFIDSITGTVMTLDDVTGIFVIGELITGQTSGATATIVLAPEIHFQQLTENINPLPRGVHEYYYDSWFDTKLLSTVGGSIPGKNVPRLIWVNGYFDTSNPVKGAVYSWTGGIAIVTSFVANTSISINPLTSWRSLGFTEDSSGNVTVIINGVAYPVLTASDIDTNTITVASTAGVSIGDTATSQIEVDVSPIPFDMCRQTKGYMYYGNWKTQKYFQSNAFNREFNYAVTDFQAIQNDLIVKPDVSSPFTGTVEEVFHIVIDSISPDINTQTFTPGSPAGGLNDAIFQGSGGQTLPAGYIGAAGDLNTYKVTIMADLTLVTGPLTQMQTGDTVIGQTSKAIGIVITSFFDTLANQWVYGMKMTTGFGYENAESIKGSSSTLVEFVDQALWQNWAEYIRNGVLLNIDTGSGFMPIAPINTVNPIILTDGLEINFVNFFGHSVGDVFQLQIRQGGADTFSWQVNKGSITSGVVITGGLQTLQDGVQIQFNSINGHTVGDFWDVTAIPTVDRAWDNFYYALPVRRPGEGYIYQLPAAFWTMDTQEDTMYVNSTFGDWGVIETTLSADLQSETVVYTPLKQAGANKVLYPYLTGHLNDELVYINSERSLDTLGRLPLIEKPQTGYLSDPVKLDFQQSSFKGGRIKYVNKRLNITSPEDGIMHVYDTFKKYWQPLKTFAEMGLLTIIGNDLACHSNIRNQTYTMFTNSSGDASGTDTIAYTVKMRTPYHAPTGIWANTMSNMSFTTGYITGAPPLVHSVYEGVNGCGGIFSHDIDPIVCIVPDRSPFGEGPFGSHSFGSDEDLGNSYFNEIFKGYSPVLQYYLISLGIDCTTTSHTYSILSMGMNGMAGETGNNSLVNPNNLAINNL